jgi:RND family efflux transporter MFP subunit
MLVRVVVPLAILVLTMLWLRGTFRHDQIVSHPDVMPAARTAPADAEVLIVKAAPREVISQAVGEVKPEFEINLASKVTAHIVQISARAGTRVSKGEVLVRLDDRDLMARVNQAQQAMARAKASRDYAQLDYDRNRTLEQKGAIPRAESDLASTRLKEAQADVERLDQSLREAQVGLGYAQIDSPMDGIVIDRLADVGDLAIPGKSLAVMFDPQHLWLQASVSEDYASVLELGRSYSVWIDALKRNLTGTLVEIVPSADASGRTVLARVRLPADVPLYPGMFGRLTLPIAQVSDVLIPTRAIRRVGQLDMVTVQASWGLEQRVVVLGQAQEDGRVQVLSGIKPEEKIVIPASQEGIR